MASKAGNDRVSDVVAAGVTSSRGNLPGTTTCQDQRDDCDEQYDQAGQSVKLSTYCNSLPMILD